MSSSNVIVFPSRADKSWSLVDLIAIVYIIIHTILPKVAAESFMTQIYLAVEDFVLFYRTGQFPAELILAASPRMILRSIAYIDPSASPREHVRAIRRLQLIAVSFGLRPPAPNPPVWDCVFGFPSRPSATSRYFLPIDEKIVTEYVDWLCREPRDGSAETR